MFAHYLASHSTGASDIQETENFHFYKKGDSWIRTTGIVNKYDMLCYKYCKLLGSQKGL